MGYITSSQGRPIQGVSQQPEKTRLPGQCTLSDNLRPDVVRGLINRQGTEVEAELVFTLTDDDIKWHHYARGTGEEYFIAIKATTGKVRVFSPDGTEHNVTVENNAESSYLATDDPKGDLIAMTIADYTFLVNKTVTVSEGTALTTSYNGFAIIYTQLIEYGDSTVIYLDGVEVAKYCAPDGSEDDHEYYVVLSYVVAALVGALTGGSGGVLADVVAGTGHGWYGVDIRTLGYSLYSDGYCIMISKDSGADFTLTVKDDNNNDNCIGVHYSMENVDLLPPNPPSGHILKIDPAGASTTDNATYWLKAEYDDEDNVTWVETIQPGIVAGYNLSTMPHVLVRESITNGVAEFTLRQGEWADREVGSDDTNPLPTFVDSDTPVAIQSMGLFQNRLFFTSGESVIMTRSSDFFNFFRETSQEVLDTDPIDVFADVPKVNYLYSNIYFDGDLVFFSENGQFIMDGSEPITASNAVLRQVTTYEAQLDVAPVASGDSIFFAFEYGRYTGIREFFTDSITDTKKARPVTDHVKQYLEGDPTIMATSTNINMLLIKTDAADNVLYAYDWLWQGAEKVQSAWGRWVFPEDDNILFFEFVESTLYLVILRDNSNIFIESIDLGDPPDTVTDYAIRLDRKTSQLMVYYSDSETWRCVDPYPLIDEDDLVMVRKTGAYEDDIGMPIDIWRETVDDVDWLVTDEELNDNEGPVTVTLGRKIECSYQPTNPVALDENGFALSLDRLTVGNFFLNYNTTGEVTATVECDSGNDYTYEYNNRIIGDTNNIVGFAPLVDGQHRVPIRQKSDRFTLTFTTSSHIPLEVRDFEFNGNLSRRGKRI